MFCSRIVAGTAARLIALATMSVVLFFPKQAAAWGEKAHLRIAELALVEIQPIWSEIAPLEKEIAQGASAADPEKSRWITSRNVDSDFSSEVQLLTSISHREDNLSRYFAYRMGVVSRTVADHALPLTGSSNPSDAKILSEFQADIEGGAISFGVRGISPERQTYPDAYIMRVAAESRLSEGAVRDAYLSGEGYGDVEDSVAAESFRRAVEAVASIWMTILIGEQVQVPNIQNYYIDQIRWSTSEGHLDDTVAALEALRNESRRLPLTPAIVGQDFFNLPFGADTGRIYELAVLVDPQSAVLAEKKRACEEYVLHHPDIKKKPEPQRPDVPRHLFGRGGKEPNIYVYQHDSGLLLLTSKVKQLGPDYVLLNFEPIKKIVEHKVRRRIGGEPQVELVDLEEIIKFYASDYNVPPALVKAVIKAESDYDPYAVSSSGARGLMQLMPSTALEMQVDEIFDPEQNVGGGVQYLARMLELFNNDTSLALAAYNAGPGNVLHYGGIPPFKETRNYVPRVLKYYDAYKKNPAPVRLKVELNKKPAADYLPEIEAVAEVREIILSEDSPQPNQPVPSGDYVIVRLKNGSTMRGKAYEEIPNGIRLILERGWIDVRQDLITEII